MIERKEEKERGWYKESDRERKEKRKRRDREDFEYTLYVKKNPWSRNIKSDYSLKIQPIFALVFKNVLSSVKTKTVWDIFCVGFIDFFGRYYILFSSFKVMALEK